MAGLFKNLRKLLFKDAKSKINNILPQSQIIPMVQNPMAERNVSLQQTTSIPMTKPMENPTRLREKLTEMNNSNNQPYYLKLLNNLLFMHDLTKVKSKLNNPDSKEIILDSKYMPTFEEIKALQMSEDEFNLIKDTLSKLYNTDIPKHGTITFDTAFKLVKEIYPKRLGYQTYNPSQNDITRIQHHIVEILENMSDMHVLNKRQNNWDEKNVLLDNIEGDLPLFEYFHSYMHQKNKSVTKKEYDLIKKALNKTYQDEKENEKDYKNPTFKTFFENLEAIYPQYLSIKESPVNKPPINKQPVENNVIKLRDGLITTTVKDADLITILSHLSSMHDLNKGKNDTIDKKFENPPTFGEFSDYIRSKTGEIVTEQEYNLIKYTLSKLYKTDIPKHGTITFDTALNFAQAIYPQYLSIKEPSVKKTPVNKPSVEKIEKETVGRLTSGLPLINGKPAELSEGLPTTMNEMVISTKRNANLITILSHLSSMHDLNTKKNKTIDRHFKNPPTFVEFSDYILSKTGEIATEGEYDLIKDTLSKLYNADLTKHGTITFNTALKFAKDIYPQYLEINREKESLKASTTTDPFSSNYPDKDTHIEDDSLYDVPAGLFNDPEEPVQHIETDLYPQYLSATPKASKPSPSSLDFATPSTKQPTDTIVLEDPADTSFMSAEQARAAAATQTQGKAEEPAPTPPPRRSSSRP